MLRLPVKIVIAFCILALGISAFGFYEVYEYNEGVLDIYAKQQDAYVKLVLDQIKLQEEGTDEETIRRILSSLESSSGEYWTLAKNHRFLYVKDTSESDTYRGYHEDNYYSSESAKEFTENLRLNRINHAQIEINGHHYVASGTIFSYGKEEYTLCLLTHEGVILYSNSFFHTNITIIITILTLVCLLTIVSMAFMEVSTRNKQKVKQMQERIEQQNQSIEELQDELALQTSYDVRDTIFHTHTLLRFLEKLEERKITPLALLVIQGREKELISFCNELFGKKYLKFALDSETYLFLYLKKTAEELKEKKKEIDAPGFHIVGIYEISDDTISYVEQYQKLGKEIPKDAEKTIFSRISL